MNSLYQKTETPDQGEKRQPQVGDLVHITWSPEFICDHEYFYIHCMHFSGLTPDLIILVRIDPQNEGTWSLGLLERVVAIDDIKTIKILDGKIV
jgi:hypothetical protein